MADDASGILAQSGKHEGWLAGLRRRAPYYAAGALIALLGLAYFDGGEEPIRPIAQQVALPGEGE